MLTIAAISKPVAAPCIYTFHCEPSKAGTTIVNENRITDINNSRIVRFTLLFFTLLN